MKKSILLLGTYCLFTSQSFAYGEYSLSELKSLSLEQLMNVDVTIATKHEKKLSSVAQPVFVISADDIRHSGANNIPEALRMVPGMQVSQIGPHDWSVTLRGFNGLLANKLLVLVDGRTIYTSMHSGTYWRDLQSMVMEDIKRIEVTRGPGGTIWGSNAVNGVINIITYSALENEGGKLVVGGGTEQQGFARMTYSKKVTEQSGIKVYAGSFKVDDADNLDGSNNQDGGDGWRTGARYDFDNGTDQLTVSGKWHESYLKYNSSHSVLTSPFIHLRNTRSSFRGGHILAKWSHQVSEKNRWAIQAFYDHNKRNDAILPTQENVWDIDFNHEFNLADYHTISWGAGYRHIEDEASNNLSYSLSPAKESRNVFNIFLQDEIFLDAEKNWQFTLGSKFEYYSLSKWEVQPSASLLWKINDQHSLWGSVSHAVRTPSRTQHDIQVFTFEELVAPNLPLFVKGSGKQGLDAENLTAYQFGWRGVSAKNVTSDVSFFYHRYTDITRTESTGNFFIDSNGFVILPGQVNNNLDAQSYGVEVALNWQVTDWWRNYFIYSFFKMDVQAKQGHNLFSPDTDEKLAPQSIASLRTQFAVTQDIDFDFWLRYTDEIESSGTPINDYIDLDLRLGWRINPNLELSVVGQNLIQTRHLEFDEGAFYPVKSTVERGVYGKLIWHF